MSLEHPLTEEQKEGLGRLLRRSKARLAAEAATKDSAAPSSPSGTADKSGKGSRTTPPGRLPSPTTQKAIR